MKFVETPQSRCRAGVARCDITPPVGIYHRMWGAATHDRSTGVHRPLTATVLALAPVGKDDSSSELILVAVDHCLLWTAEMNSLLDLVSQGAGVDREALVVLFSHTHGAGLMGLERRELPGGELIPQYLSDLASKVTSSVIEARQGRTDASIVYGTGRCSLATHRDLFDTERGRYVCGFNPEGPADDTVLVARIAAGDGQPLATVVNYACHPTTLAWQNTLISPDYIGAMREVIEAETEVPCFFIQGASGDIGPREGFVGDIRVADRNGRELGFAALSALESLPSAGQRFQYDGPVVSGATLGTWSYIEMDADRAARTHSWKSLDEVIPLRYRADLPSREQIETDLANARTAEAKALAAGDAAQARDQRAMIERATRSFARVGLLPKGDSYPFPLIIRQIGDAIWIALNGEHYNVLQRTLRSRFPDTPIIIGTIANGSAAWYLPDATSFGKGLYQEEASILAQGALEQVIEAAVRAIEDLTQL